MLDAFAQFQWTDLVDVMLVAVLLWASFTWLRHARSRLAFFGLLLLSGVYLAARELELQLTVWILQGFFTVLVLVLVVVFQEDLKRIFEQIAVWGLRRRPPVPTLDVVDVLVRFAEREAQNRVGALIVIPGREPLDRHLEGGIELNARPSMPLLLSLFDTRSPGHDGAVIMSGSLLSRFAVHLPLSTNHARLFGGTRHAAALGLAERCDALCIVVSEERGTISVARDGVLRRLPSADYLGGEIQAFLADISAAPTGDSAWRGLRRRWPQAVAAFVLAAVLWAVLVPGGSQMEVSRQAPVIVDNVPAGYQLVKIDPPAVAVTVSGPRRLIPEDPEAIRVRIDAELIELGRRTFRLSPLEVELPPGLTVQGIDPAQVRLSVERTAGR